MGIIEKKLVLEYIYDILASIKLGEFKTEAIYHHNTNYKYISSVVKNGILTCEDIDRLGISKLTEKQKTILSSEGHVNGMNGISLSVVGLTDLYRNEWVYDPLSKSAVDILVIPKSIPQRSTYNYGNEFIHIGSIPQSEISTIDIRLMKLIAERNDFLSVEETIDKFNNLIEAANQMIELDLGIPIREMSNEDNIELDINKLARIQKIEL